MDKKFGLLQIFRGVAAMAVALHHVGNSAQPYFKTDFFWNFFSPGNLGVDFFFTISGFIITYVHIKNIEFRSGSALFLKKRLIRIYPLYWVVATVSLVVILFVLHGTTQHLDHTMDVHSLSEWAYISGSYFLIPMKHRFFISAAWTLSFEMLFYLVFYVAIMTGIKGAKLIWMSWLLVLLIINTTAVFFKIDIPFAFSPQVIEFLVGCFIAYRFTALMKVNKYVVWFVLATSFLSLIVFHAISIDASLPFVYTLVAAIFCASLLVTILRIDTFGQKRYSKTFLLIGEASYSIYLWHGMVVALFLRFFSSLAARFNLTNFPLIQVFLSLTCFFAIVMAIALYGWIEKPLLAYLNKRFVKRGDHLPGKEGITVKA